MFDKKTVQIYKNISAPETLRERMLNLNIEKQKKYSVFKHYYRQICAAAACLVLITALSIALYGNSEPSVLFVLGEEVTEEPIVLSIPYTASSRLRNSTGFTINFDIDTKKAATITVNAGDIAANESKPAKSLNIVDACTIYWKFDNAEDASEANLAVDAGGNKTVYELTCDDNGIWSIYKIE